MAWADRHDGFVYSDAPPPKFDLWGQPIREERQEEFKDSFAGGYMNGEQPDLR